MCNPKRQPFIFIFMLIATIVTLGALATLLLPQLRSYVFTRHATEPSSVTEISRTGATSTPYLHGEEAVIVQPKDTSTSTPTMLPVKQTLFEYIEVTDGCGIHYQGECVNVRSGPGTEYPVVAQLRNDIVLRVNGQVEHEGHTWYKVVFDETLRYPERVASDWYVAADYVTVLRDEGEKTLWDNSASSTEAVATTSKRIVVDRSEQMLYAYDGDTLFMKAAISTGLELTPTPRGTFTVYKKTPSRYMQGPLPGISDQYYDLPGVPWNLYFSKQGAVIHGAYWHNSFGHPYSHGCVNLPPDTARKLYNWAPLGTKVVVQD